MKTMVMIFSFAGEDTEEEFGVREINGNIVTLDTDEELNKCKKFNLKTGICLNDDNSFGARRKLKI